MEFRYFTMAKLIFLVMWTTVCGPLSGFTMGLFFLVYQDGYRKGVLPLQPDGRFTGFFGDLPSFAMLTSRYSSDHRG
jgi:hypothetical protein